MNKYNPYNKVSRIKKIVVVTGLFASLFGGMFAYIVAIDNFKNFDRPYLFGFVLGTIGLLIGLWIANKLKPKIIINQKMQQNYYQLTILFIVIGFTGIITLLGQRANIFLSTKVKCDNYFVADKIFRKGGHRRTELNILVIEVDGVYHRYITNPNYWRTVAAGQQVHVCIYKSKIGFDFIKLINEN